MDYCLLAGVELSQAADAIKGTGGWSSQALMVLAIVAFILFLFWWFKIETKKAEDLNKTINLERTEFRKSEREYNENLAKIARETNEVVIRFTAVMATKEASYARLIETMNDSMELMRELHRDLSPRNRKPQ